MLRLLQLRGERAELGNKKPSSALSSSPLRKEIKPEAIENELRRKKSEAEERRLKLLESCEDPNMKDFYKDLERQEEESKKQPPKKTNSSFIISSAIALTAVGAVLIKKLTPKKKPHEKLLTPPTIRSRL